MQCVFAAIFKRKLKAEGINFPNNSRGLYLGDVKLEFLMEELNK